MKILWSLALSLLAVQGVNGQNIKLSGKLVDKETKEAVVGANVLLINIKDSTASKFAASDPNGEFIISQAPRAFYRLQIKTVNYKLYNQIIRLTQDVNLGVIQLTPDTTILESVKIQGQVIPVEQKGDTTVYNANAFETNPDASASDLVSKMPGITVSDTGVESNGETVQQVLLDGKRFFGQDPLLALNTIPAEMVNQVEVFDQLSERSQFTGFDDGNTVKTMNLVTREDKRTGQFGKFYAGIGTDNRYLLEGNVNDFKKDRRLSILGMSNNINKKNFTDSDLTGVRSGRRGGNRFLGGGATLVPAGITQTESFGLNYTNEKKDKWKIESSYFFDRAELDNEEDINRELFLAQGSQQYTENSTSNSVNRNHRFNTRYEYFIDDRNSIVFTPNATVQNNESTDFTSGQTVFLDQLLNQTENNYRGDNSGFRLDGNLLFRHKFEKRGRALLFNLGSTLNHSEGENIFEDLQTDSLFLYSTEVDNHTYRSELTYVEPVGLSSQLQFSYQFERNDRNSDITTSETTLDDDERLEREDLSSDLNSLLTVHRPSINLSKRSFGQFYSIELALQRTILDNNQSILDNEQYFTSHTFTKVLPSILGRLQLGDNTNLFVRYNTQLGTPTSNQLQEVIDNSNPLFYSTGNADLSQSYTHQVMARLRKSNTDKNTSIANFTLVSNTVDKISTAIYTASSDSVIVGDVVLPRGGQISRPVNVDGYWNVRNNTTYSFVLNPLKLNVSASLGLSYIRNPGIVDGLENISQTYNSNARLNFASNISKKVDFNLRYFLNLNHVENSVSSNRNDRYTTQTISGKLNLIFFKGFVFRSDLNYQIFRGTSEAFDTNYALWNVSVAKKFLKDNLGELTLSVFDLLGQNQSVTQDVSTAYFEETRSRVLEQYWMLSFTYQLRKFKNKS